MIICTLCIIDKMISGQNISSQKRYCATRSLCLTVNLHSIDSSQNFYICCLPRNILYFSIKAITLLLIVLCTGLDYKGGTEWSVQRRFVLPWLAPQLPQHFQFSKDLSFLCKTGVSFLPVSITFCSSRECLNTDCEASSCQCNLIIFQATHVTTM